MLHPEMSERQDIRERFRREARAANSVGHPARSKSSTMTSPKTASAFLVMELLEGEPVTARANRELVDTNDLLAGWIRSSTCLPSKRTSKGSSIATSNPTTSSSPAMVGEAARLRDRAREPMRCPTASRPALARRSAPRRIWRPSRRLGRSIEIEGARISSRWGHDVPAPCAPKIHEVKNDADMLVAMATMPAPPLSWVAKGAARSAPSSIARSLFCPADGTPTRERCSRMCARCAREPPPYAAEQKPKASSHGSPARHDRPRTTRLRRHAKSARSSTWDAARERSSPPRSKVLGRRCEAAPRPLRPSPTSRLRRRSRSRFLRSSRRRRPRVLCRRRTWTRASFIDAARGSTFHPAVSPAPTIVSARPPVRRHPPSSCSRWPALVLLAIVGTVVWFAVAAESAGAPAPASRTARPSSPHRRLPSRLRALRRHRLRPRSPPSPPRRKKSRSRLLASPARGS